MIMILVNATGMKRQVCGNCFEYPENCQGCEWHNCSVCGKELGDSDCYSYRGAYACSEHHEESIKKRDIQRAEVMEKTEHSVRSQADGEWANGGYKTMKTDRGGRPLTKIKEPQFLKDYEDGK